MQIVPFGFKELWLVQRDTWTLPIHCDPFSSDARGVTHWHVKPAQQLLSAPFEELRKLFGPKNLSDSTKASWYVSDEDLKAVATKATGCDASQYLKWNKEEQEPAELLGAEEVQGPSRVEQKFLTFLCKRAAIDPKLGRYFWAALKDAMLHWLINTQRPIDFEIFEIQPIPYRANWKEIMLAKHPAVARIFSLPKEKWRDELTKCGFMQNLGSSDLVAMDSHIKTFAWTLELEPKKLWLDAMEEAESARMKAKKPANYLRYYENCIRNRLDDTLRTYAAWLKEIKRAVGKLSESRVSGAPILLPIPKRDLVLPSWQRPNQVTFQPSDGPLLIQGQGAKRSVAKKAKEMLRVPDFQQHNEDMRLRRESELLAQPSDRPDGSGRLSLPHADQGEAEVIDVLAERHGAEERGVES